MNKIDYILNKYTISQSSYDNDTRLAYDDIFDIYQDLDLNILEQVDFLIIKPDAILEHQTLDILDFLNSYKIEILGYKIKTYFYEFEKEAIYRYCLNDGRNNWYIRKEIFEIGPSIGLIVKSNVNIFQLMKKLKGSSNALTADLNTIRKIYGKNMVMNAIHSSDDPISVIRESKYFFTKQEIYDILHKNFLYDDIKILIKYFENSTDFNYLTLLDSLFYQILYKMSDTLRACKIPIDPITKICYRLIKHFCCQVYV